jgi:hypothetical protein
MASKPSQSAGRRNRKQKRLGQQRRDAPRLAGSSIVEKCRDSAFGRDFRWKTSKATLIAAAPDLKPRRGIASNAIVKPR